MKKTLVIVYALLFTIAWFGLVSAGSSTSVSPSIPTVSEKAIVGTDYNLIANKIFSKFLIKYPNLLSQVSCENIDGYINKILQKTKIKFRNPDINKENTVKHIFENLLRNYLDNNLECDDYIDVDRDDTDVWTEEYVKCMFDDGYNNVSQSCYSSDGRWSCEWVGSCTIKVSGNIGETIARKSSLGWYAYTTIDWQNDYANFYSQPQPMPMPVCNWLDGGNIRCANPVYGSQTGIINLKIDNSKLKINDLKAEIKSTKTSNTKKK